ncbi:cell division protein ZapA [Lacihabitans soyangensis]|jgi:cell division protein ZapA (FtsZ GTPase activity inhibitor)|uniref:Cell division protein ZapA n=1 Tax=Lacihabitans soyangensis TaxID=869394 RepID=A0AAE3H0K6_9BACT|nr:cell division protein ZapA [Lacihabitans soyangensis]MCP9762754.1 cell division protein ZapA [Lacihabitans soyangensis]
MESYEAKVVFDFNGEQINFKVPKAHEYYYREANKILNNRLTELKTEYSAFATTDSLVSVLALEAMVDALMANEHYHKLKIEVDARLESIQSNFDN